MANGGTLYQTRLVQQVQGVDNDVAAAYEVRARRDVGISPDVLATVKKGMVMVVDHGTAAQARVPNVEVAGKTGTAQWGAGNNDKSKSRTAWWFAGFAPADKPQYAFASLVEGDPSDKRHSSETAVPIVGKVLREIYKNEKPAKVDKKHKKKDDDDDDSDDNSPESKKKDKEFEQDMQDSD